MTRRGTVARGTAARGAGAGCGVRDGGYDPAMARDRHDDDGISAGEIIAGAVVILYTGYLYVIHPLASLAQGLQDAPHHEVLLNLSDEVPQGFGSFERLIEVVGCDEADRAAARVRWKHYMQRGYALVRHDLAPRGA